MIYYNGNYVEAGQLVDSRDRGFLLGDGLFETILIKEGRPVFLQEHIERLQEAGVALSIKYPQNRQGKRVEFLKIIQKLAQANNITHGQASARITISRGVGARGLLFPPLEQENPTVMVSVTPLLLPPDYYSVMVSEYVRARYVLSSRFKTLNYLENTMARNQAHQQGVDEAIMLNDAGRVACGSASNIFGVTREGKLLTPCIKEGALPGITRKKIINLARSLNIECMETRIEKKELSGFDLFFTNSLIGIVPHKNTTNPLISTLSHHYDKIVTPTKIDG